jgi:hypothetical protein
MKPLLVLLVLLLQAPAWADWVKVDETDKTVVYVDPERIQKNAQFPTAWQLSDYRSMTKRGVLSSQNLIEFDCKAKRRRTLAFVSHAENMGEGAVKFKNLKAGQWHAVPHESVAEQIMEMACEH